MSPRAHSGLLRWASTLAPTLALAGCPGDDAGSGGSDSASEGGTADTTGGDAPSSGLLACAAGESCTLVLVAQALDDRVEVYTARGPGERYRGAIDLDLKPNPMGDNSGDFLDEPYGMTIDDSGLSLLLGHYPQRHAGSLLHFPHAFLAAQPDGGTIAASTFFADGSFVAPVQGIALDEEEPIFVVTHPSGRLIVGVFDNDLFQLESAWTNPGQLAIVDPATGEVAKRPLTELGGMGCAGAWSLVWLDDAHTRLGVGCDGDEGAALLDVSGLGEGTVAQAAAAIDGCIANVPFSDKRVRYLAPDGAGGIVIAESTPQATGEDGRLYRFDADCNALGAPGTIAAQYWEAREIVRLPHADGNRWLLATGRTEGHLHVVRDGMTGAEICSTLDELDPYWTGDDGVPVHPFALALDRAGHGLAIGAGPIDPPDDMPGSGRVLWLELDGSVDPCDASPITDTIDLSAAAPAVAADDPATWRRGPNVVFVQQYG
ncbi:MAG: hypothetical protein K1X88_13680 [Nannocystaceae bacterium]|nr:hypothetical protein [Nannocystaceae bacterium]